MNLQEKLTLIEEVLDVAEDSLTPETGTISHDLIDCAFHTEAPVAIIPVQDLLGLGSGARMNRPATTEGNWQWRLQPGEPRAEDWAWLRELTIRAGRHSPAAK